MGAALNPPTRSRRSTGRRCAFELLCECWNVSKPPVRLQALERDGDVVLSEHALLAPALFLNPLDCDIQFISGPAVVAC